MRMKILFLATAGLCCLVVLEGAALVHEGDGDQDVLPPEDNAVETFAETEKRLKKLVNSGFKLALPYLMTAATKIQLNRKCLQGLLMLMGGVMDIRDWAIKMVDALGKPSAGILEGTATAMGDYDECLDIVVPKRMRPAPVPPYTEKQIAFYGQYCVVQIDLPEGIRQAAMDYQAGNRTHSELANTKTFLKNLVKIAPRADVANFHLGVCLPSICNKMDLQAIVDEISDIVKLSATAIRCETKQSKQVYWEQIVILSTMGLIALLVGFGTAMEVYMYFTNENGVDDSMLQKKSVWVQSIVAFSFPRNTRKLLSFVHTDSPKISCLRGMKFISVCLYVVVWTYATPQDYHFLKYRSAFYFHKFMEEWWFTVFANASAGVDTLFLIGGLQISYRMWWKGGGENAKVNILKFILKWFSRFTLCHVIVIALFLCLPLMGNGPIWADVVSPIQENCKQRWWLNILALNNFWPSDKTCLPHTWLVCCLFHMTLVAPILLFILSKSKTVGIFVNVICIIGSSIGIAMVTLMNDLPPAPAFYFMSFINIKSIWQMVFIQAYDHIGPFCVGILLGYFLNLHDQVKLSKTTVVFGWLCAVTCNLAVMCGLYGYRHGEKMEITLSAIYASLHRVVWAISMSWVVFSCAYGYGGVVNKILSWKILIPLDRLAILTYMLHPLILFLHEGQLRERIYMAHLDMAMYATAYIVFTVAIAGLCYITCVSPFLYFEKRLLWYYESYSTSEGTESPSQNLKESIREKIDICKEKGKFHCYQHSVTLTQKYNKTLNT